MRAISTFIFDNGMSTRRCLLRQAFRIRVSMSAIGSVMLMKYYAPIVSLRTFRNGKGSPARLAHAGDEPLEGHLAERDAGETELAEVGARAAGHRAPVADA